MPFPLNVKINTEYPGGVRITCMSGGTVGGVADANTRARSEAVNYWLGALIGLGVNVTIPNDASVVATPGGVYVILDIGIGRPSSGQCDAIEALVKARAKELKAEQRRP